MTWPEDTIRPTAAPTSRKAPNLAIGYLLNVLLPGAGFTYIGLVGWHVGWVGILLALNLTGALLVGLTTVPVFGVLPLVGFVIMLVHFGQAYAWRAAQQFRPDLEAGVKIGLIAGHAVLNVAAVGLLAAVLMPGLLGARERAERSVEQAAAMSAYTLAISAQAEGTLRDGPCPLVNVYKGERITSCTVTGAATADPKVSVMFSSGHNINLP
ncbi:hypothetical protein [Deinococcus sp. PEB2-63]